MKKRLKPVVVAVPDIPRLRKYAHMCWAGNTAKAVIERCNRPRKHAGAHSWETNR